MINEFFRCAASLLALTLTGYCAYLIIIKREDRRWPDAVLYGWGAGIVLLFVLGGFLVKIKPLFFHWQWYVLAVALAIVAAFFILCFSRLTLLLPKSSGHSSNPRIDAWSTLMILFIAFHSSVLLWINLNHPAFDADAIDRYRWLGLAKEIYRFGGLPASLRVWNPIYPSLIPLWANAFTARWFDSFAALPWYCCYIAVLGLAYRFVYRVTGHVKAGLFICCLLVSVPLLWVHVIRPGFSDLIVCYFVAAVLTTLFYSFHYRDSRYFILSLIFMLGACMSKQEAMVWMLLVYLNYGILYLHVRLRKPAARILMYEGASLVAIFTAYLLSANYIHNLISGRFTHLGLLFQIRYDPKAFWYLIERTFTWGTFGIYWYLFGGTLLYLVLTSRSTFVRLLCAQYILIFGLLLYYLCGTGNVKYTLTGTNASRLLLQWIPSGILIYTLVVLQAGPGGRGVQDFKAAPAAFAPTGKGESGL